MDHIEKRLPKGIKEVKYTGHQNLLKGYNAVKTYNFDEIYIELYRFEKQNFAVSESKKLNVRQTSTVYLYGVSGAYLFIIYAIKEESRAKAMKVVADLAGEE